MVNCNLVLHESALLDLVVVVCAYVCKPLMCFNRWKLGAHGNNNRCVYLGYSMSMTLTSR